MISFRFEKVGVELVLTFGKVRMPIHGSCIGLPDPNFLERINIQEFLLLQFGRWIFEMSIKNRQNVSVSLLNGFLWFHTSDYYPMNYALMRLSVCGVLWGWKRPASFWYKSCQKRLRWRLETIRLFNRYGWNFQDVGSYFCGDRPHELK